MSKAPTLADMEAHYAHLVAEGEKQQTELDRLSTEHYNAIVAGIKADPLSRSDTPNSKADVLRRNVEKTERQLAQTRQQIAAYEPFLAEKRRDEIETKQGHEARTAKRDYEAANAQYVAAVEALKATWHKRADALERLDRAAYGEPDDGQVCVEWVKDLHVRFGDRGLRWPNLSRLDKSTERILPQGAPIRVYPTEAAASYWDGEGVPA